MPALFLWSVEHFLSTTIAQFWPHIAYTGWFGSSHGFNIFFIYIGLDIRIFEHKIVFLSYII